MSNGTNSNAIISKWKNIFSIFFCISEIYIKFGILSKRRWASDIICFQNYRLQKAGLLKWLKCPVSEHLWTVNMLKGPKHCLNLHSSIFAIYFDHCEGKLDRYFHSFFLNFKNLHKILNTFEKKLASEVIGV